MTAGAASVALSGVRASGERLRAAAHNVANLLTEEFRPERVVCSAEAQGGVSTRVEGAALPGEVDLGAQIVEQDLAALAGRASARVLEVQLEMLGSVLDLQA